MGTVAKNTAFMTAASIGQKIVAFVYFTLVARNLGVEDTGRYVLALSFTTLFVVLIDLGLTNVFVREAARAQEKISQFLGNILGVKLFLGVATYLIMIIALQFFGYAKEVNTLIYLSGITMLFDSFHLSLYGALRALGHLRFEATAMVGSQCITLVLGGVALYLRLPLIFLMLAFTVPSMLNALYASYTLRRTYHISLRPLWDTMLIKTWARVAIPFALAAVFARLYSYTDTILLSKMVGEKAVGLYSVPYKITYAFQFIPLALVAAVYPRLSEYFLKDKNAMTLLFIQSIKYLTLAVTPIVVGIITIADSLVPLLFGREYTPAIVPLKILMLSLLFSFLSFPVGACINASNKQLVQTKITALALLVNVGMNVWLIPQFEVRGAAIAAVVGNSVLFFVGYGVVSHILSLPHRNILWFMARVAVSALGMAVAVSLTAHIHVFVGVACGVLVYPALLFLTGVVTKADLAQVRAMIQR